MTNSILKCKELCCCCDNEIPEEDKDLDGYCYECHSASHTYCCSCEAYHYTDSQSPGCAHIFWNEEESLWDGAGAEENLDVDKEKFHAFLDELNEQGVYWQEDHFHSQTKYPDGLFFDELIASIENLDKEEIRFVDYLHCIKGSGFKHSGEVYFDHDFDFEDHWYVIKWLHSLSTKSPTENQKVIEVIKQWRRSHD